MPDKCTMRWHPDILYKVPVRQHFSKSLSCMYMRTTTFSQHVRYLINPTNTGNEHKSLLERFNN